MKYKCVTCGHIGNETNKLKLLPTGASPFQFSDIPEHGVWVCNRFQCISNRVGETQPRLVAAWKASGCL